MRQNLWIRALDYLIESCWLLALVAVPIFFDTLTVRIFEPDKIVLFRNVVLVMVVALLIRLILTAPAALAQPAPSANGGDAPIMPAVPWRRRLMARWPMLLPVAIFTLIYALATEQSVLPGISFWGSYDRLQGLYTWLSYIAFCAVIAYSLRSWAQIERIISALVFTSIPVSIYGVMQHYHLDPVQWGAPTDVRVASTLGNAIFLGAYVIMCMPFAAYRLWSALERMRTPEPAPTTAPSRVAAGRNRPRPRDKDTIEISGLPPIVPVIGYVLVLIVEFAALYFCGSRGPYYGLVVGIVALGIPLTIKFANPYPAIAGIVLGVVIFGFPQAVNVFSSITQAAAANTSSTAADAQHLTSFDISGTAEVRQFIWSGSVHLIAHRPILGSGPETMIYVYSPYYPSGLGHLEHANAAPDRNHDMWLDFLVFSGILGLLAFLVVLVSFAWVIWGILRRTRSRQVTILTAALSAVVLGHLVEASVGIPIVSTLMILWTLFAVASAIYARRELLGDAPATAAQADSSPATDESAGRNAVKARNSNSARQQQRGPRSTVQVAPPRPSFERLSSGQQGGLLALIVVTLIAIVGGFVLFGNNVQVVRADAAYKLGQAYDNAGSACLFRASNPADPQGAACPLVQTATQQQAASEGGQLILAAINYYQEANGDQPSQDMYYLWLGKSYLDLARYDQIVQHSGDVPSAFQNAEHALKTARALNPYNADHPMNLGRMYHGWAGLDPSKWSQMDTYFAIAVNLARHNGRWADEWGNADMDQAARRPGITAAQRTVLYTQALHTFQHASDVDDLLGDARALRGRAYAALGMYKQAAQSYAEALKIGGFEPGVFAQSSDPNALLSIVVQEMITSLHAAKDYTSLARPAKLLLAPNLRAGVPDYLNQSPVTLAYSPTLQLYESPAFSQTLQVISTTLHAKGLVK